MTAYTSPKTWTAATLTVADMNTEIRDNLKNIDERLTVSGITSPSAISKVKSALCGVLLAAPGDTTATDGTDKLISWGNEDWDTDGFHSTSSNTHRITIPSGLDGTYLFSAHIGFESNATNTRQLWIEDSAGTKLISNIARAVSTGRTEMQVTLIRSCSAGDWFAVHVTQDSGSTLAVYQALTRHHFSAVRLFAA